MFIMVFFLLSFLLIILDVVTYIFYIGIMYIIKDDEKIEKLKHKDEDEPEEKDKKEMKQRETQTQLGDEL